MEGLDFRTYEREIQALNNMGIFEEASVLSLITIKVDAHSGQVIMKYFWDGVYVD